MVTTRRVARAKPTLQPAAPPANVVTQLELVDFFHRKAVLELVAVEVAPALYRLEALILWRIGRCTLLGTQGPRQFRSLDTLARHLKTLGVGRTVTRLELLG